MSFKITKGLPIPPKEVSGGAPHKYPVSDMKKGDSFDVPIRHESGEGDRQARRRLHPLE